MGVFKLSIINVYGRIFLQIKAQDFCVPVSKIRFIQCSLQATLHIQCGMKTLEIRSYTFHSFRSVKEEIKTKWKVPKTYQQLYSDGKELRPDSKCLWDFAEELETTKGMEKVRLAILQKLKNWKMTLMSKFVGRKTVKSNICSFTI